MNGRDPRRPGLLYWLAFAVALALRLVWLDLRPLHHDEALNASLLLDLAEGRGYAYNPIAYHGPALYLLGWLPTRLLGVGTVALRLPVALVSASMILLLLPLRRRLGRAGATLAAWLLALSPSLVFFGRDLIHETYLATVTLLLVAAVSLWAESRRRLDLLLAAGSVALLFTIKETALLTLLGLAFAAILTWGPRRVGCALRLDRSDLAWTALVFASVWIAAYTTLFTHARGLADSFRAYLPWLRKGVGSTLHDKPWTYFLQLLGSFEAAILLSILAGGALVLWQRRRGNSEVQAPETGSRFALFCLLWAGAELALYSAIPYKTPWLMINIVVPGALAAGALLGELFESRSGLDEGAASTVPPLPRRSRRWLPGLLTFFFVLLLGWSAWRAGDAAFRRYDDPAIGLVYSDTRREVWELLAYVRRAAAASTTPGGATFAAYLPTRWPLRWYLRDLPNATWQRQVSGRASADVLLSDPDLEPALAPLVEGVYSRREFPLRPNVLVVVRVRRPGDGPRRGK